MGEFLRNKKILIIGGTGTVGTYLVNYILPFNPNVIRILSRDEYKQFLLQQKFAQHRNIRYLIGDVRDFNRLQRAMEDIDYVFHAAAMKHVPSCEYNPFEAVQTNVIGTQNVIQAVLSSGVKKVLFTSTDKAIAPTNTYGATKLTAEKLISAAEYQKGSKPAMFCSVRFGNVMGSRGSVIPLFKEQILTQRKITVTDMNMIRYMMTPFQAISLMLKAMEECLGGEVFVLKMPVVRLSDLAHVVCEEVSKKYNITEPVDIEEIGIRPGEKLYEELMTEIEWKIAEERADMFVLPPMYNANSNEITDRTMTMKQYLLSTPPISRETLRDWIITEGLI